MLRFVTVLSLALLLAACGSKPREPACAGPTFALNGNLWQPTATELPR